MMSGPGWSRSVRAAEGSTASTRRKTCCAATFTAPTGIIPDFQELHAGDLILLAPAEAPCFRVAKAERPQVLVLVGAGAKTRALRPVPATPEGMASTWQWVLRPADCGRSTRLVACERYTYPRRQWQLWHVIEAVSSVMERRMLHGIKARAEGRYAAAAVPPVKTA